MAREKNNWMVNRQVNVALSNNESVLDIRESILAMIEHQIHFLNIRILIFLSLLCYLLLLSHLLLFQSYFFTAEAWNFQIRLCSLSVNNAYTSIDLSGIDISKLLRFCQWPGSLLAVQIPSSISCLPTIFQILRNRLIFQAFCDLCFAAVQQQNKAISWKLDEVHYIPSGTDDKKMTFVDLGYWMFRNI